MKKQNLFIGMIIGALLMLTNVQSEVNAYSFKKEKASEVTQVTDVATDYSDKSNWMYFDAEPKHEVDLLYFYPTATIDSPDDSGVGVINDTNKKSARAAFANSGSAFLSYTNVYAPYYRQVTAKYAMQVKNEVEYKEFTRNSKTKTDVFAALDYYFNNLNKNRPFIISSHSQGSVVMQIAFEEYFSKHPKYLKRMIAAYMVGFPVTKQWLRQNHLKFVKGETDTGVIISWYTEGPNATGGGANKAWLSVNPINWKLDATPATVQQNKGSLIMDMNTQKGTLVSGGADATINTKRGTVICTTNQNYSKELAHLFGDKTLHLYDYSLYYANIKENGLKRIEAYLGHKAK